jgi:hypothetical protein
MPNHEEIEQALRELFQNVQTVPGTLPPVYTCEDFLIGFDGQGQVKVTGSMQTEFAPPLPEPDRFKRWQARFLSSSWGDKLEQNLPENGFKRWFGERSWWIKAT